MRWDAVIAGGGLSGLSLACHLAASGWRDRAVLVVDDGAQDLSQRAWASWSVDPGLLGPAVGARYSALRVHAAGQDQQVGLGRYHYEVVRGGDLRRAAARLLAAAPGFACVRGRVDAVIDGADGATVVVDGRPVRCSWAFDSLLAAQPPAQLALSFVGWRVRTPTPAFDPSVPVLMDFRTDQAGEVRFVYVLPTSDRDALVEHTAFGSPTATGREAALRTYFEDVLALPAPQVLGVERGVVPLALALPRPHGGHVLPIGVRGGQLKPSTGYAYTRIQRDSAAIAASLTRRGHPFDLPDPSRRHRYLDAVLLDLMVHEPARVEEAFAQLFTRNPGERVLRFLDEDTSPAAEARLIASLAPAPFIQAAKRVARTPPPAPRARTRSTRSARPAPSVAARMGAGEDAGGRGAQPAAADHLRRPARR